MVVMWLSFVAIAISPLVTVSHAIQWDVFSTKTSYFWSYNASSVSASLGDIGTCAPVQVSTVVRHGARNPTSSSIKEIKELHTKLLTHKASDKATFIDGWTSRYNFSTQGELVPAGAREQEFVGSRYGRVFKSLFGTGHQGGAKFELVTSRKQRTIDSARSFYEGFARMTGRPEPFTSRVNDSLTRFYDGCVRYETMVTDNATNFQQFEEFSSTPEFQKVGKAVKQRLGLNITLTPDDLYTIYDLCAYEAYIFNETAWCGLMTDGDRKVLEYGMDVQNYYESMYGNPLNTEVACPLARDIFYTMDEAVRAMNSNKTSSYVAGKFQFSHSETVAKLLAFLGLFKEPAGMMASNMAAMEARHFRSSHVLPYSANVAFVLYSCTSGSGQQQFKVQVSVNEENIALPACGNKLLCDYDVVRQAYSRLVNSCNEKQFCSMHPVPIVG